MIRFSLHSVVPNYDVNFVNQMSYDKNFVNQTSYDNNVVN